MSSSRSRLYKPALVAAIIPLLALSGMMQRRLNHDRIGMGITRGEPLGNTAPPVLVFTTVALGGFRGLIANALWVRAADLQEQDKYFEKVQLADWITKLQPHFTTVCNLVIQSASWTLTFQSSSATRATAGNGCNAASNFCG